MVLFLLIYLILGLVWTKWLENYTRKHFQMPNMNNTEISINVIFWPFQLVVFLYYYFLNL